MSMSISHFTPRTWRIDTRGLQHRFDLTKLILLPGSYRENSHWVRRGFSLACMNDMTPKGVFSELWCERGFILPSICDVVRIHMGLLGFLVKWSKQVISRHSKHRSHPHHHCHLDFHTIVLPATVSSLILRYR